MRHLTYFISDVHLGLPLSDCKEREARLVGFLHSICNGETAALYMLGDIWDFWYEYRDVVPKGYCRVFAALLDLLDEGVEVFFVPGNHDIWAYGYFEELGIKKLSQPWYLEAGGNRICVAHGDALGPVGVGYRIMNGAFKNRVIQALFSTLHPWIAFRIGCRWSLHSRKRHLSKGKYVFKGKDEPVWKYAEAHGDFPSGGRVDTFIFGHFHTMVDEKLSTGARMMIMEDWLESSPYIVADSEDGSCTFGHFSCAGASVEA